MKTQHTPGPWNINNSHIEGEPYRLVIYGEARRIALCYKEGNSVYVTKAEAESNARLIAAAPELLEMLEKILPKLSQLQDESAFTIPEKVESLIAKAKGE